MASILAQFVRFPEEAAIIGRLIAGYGELEFDLAFCVRWIINDEDTAFKVMFRGPGEMQRILMADAMARLKLPAGKQRTMFEQVIAGMNHCRKIRNQYAHCHWMEMPNRQLFFLQLEEIASLHTTVVLSNVTYYPITLDLLQEQEAFFVNVRDRITYLIWEAQLRTGEISSTPQKEAPREAPMPKLHN